MAIRYLSGINVDSNTLFVDSTNNRVGIGTANPGVKLDVVGDIRSTANEGKVSINSTAANGKQYEFISIDTGNLGVYDGTAYRLWISGGGAVGIGNTNPTAKLEITYDGDDAAGIRLRGDGNDTSLELRTWNNGATIQAYQSAFTTADGVLILNSAGGNVLIGTTTDGGYKLNVSGTGYFSNTLTLGGGSRLAAVTGNALNFNTNGSDVAQFTTTGHLGIGVTPNAWQFFKAVQVNGGNAFVGYEDQAEIWANSYYDGAFKYYGNGYANRLALIDGDFTFNSAPLNSSGAGAALTFSQRMKIANGGQVTIGAYGSGTFTGTATYGLAVDSSGNIIEVTSTIDGSGTANYVTKWIDGNTIGNSQIFDNGTSVGINNASPSSSFVLDVHSRDNAYNTRIYQPSSSTGAYVSLLVSGAMTSAVGYFGAGGSAAGNASFRDNVVIGSQSAHPLVLNTSDAERMRITSAGNVGIGTTSPGFKLNVVGGNGNQLGLDNAGERFTQISFLENGSQNSAIWLDGTDNMFDIYANTSHGIRLKTGGDNTRLTITSGGNVLIGTTTDAGYKLRVNGTGRYDGNVQLYADSAGNSPRLVFGGETSSTDKSIFLESYYMVFQGHNNEGFKFQTTTSLGAVTNRMSILGSGTIQISNYGSGSKTGTVAYNLAVDSSGNIIETPGGVVDGSGTANYVTKWQDANTITDSNIIADGTNVGVGVVSPQSRLDVATSPTQGTIATLGYSANANINIRIPNVVNDVGQIVFTNASSPTAGYAAIGVVMTNGASVGIGDLIFGTKSVGTDAASTERMRITSAGKVGIGTDSPTLGLQVGDGLGLIVGNSGASGSVYVSPQDENTINGSYGIAGDSADLWLNYKGYQDGTAYFRDTRIGNGKGTAITYWNGDTGNMMIGTTTDSGYRLDVVGDARANFFFSGNSSTNGTTIQSYGDQFKKVWTTLTSFSFTGAGVYYFNLVFQTGWGFTYDLTATTSRSGNWRNFGSLRDNSYLNVESDGDFETYAVGDLQMISNNMYLDAVPTAFKSATTTASGVNGTSPWAYHIVRYAIYIPTYVANVDGFFQVHLTTYGYEGNAPLFINA